MNQSRGEIFKLFGIPLIKLSHVSKWVWLAVLILAVQPCFATSHFVRAGATGNGSGADWTNACTDFTGSCAISSLVRGHTYYVASGTYAAETFNTPDSGTLVITIKGATVADHGTNTGWQNTFSVSNADGGSQALWTCCLSFNTDYWTWDGNYGPLWDNNRADYGFNVPTPGDCATAGHNFVGIGVSTTNVTIRHVSMTGCGSNSWAGLGGGNDHGVVFGMFINPTTYNSNNTIGNSYFVNFNSDVVLAMANNDVIEYCYLDQNWSTPLSHGETVNVANGSQGGNVIRYNRMTKTQGTATVALIFTANGDDCVGRSMSIYGNLVEGAAGGDGVFAAGGPNQSFCNTVVYNNTIVNSGGVGFFAQCQDGGPGVPAGCAVATGNVVENNLVWNGVGAISQDYGGNGYGGAITQDYNSCFSCKVNFSAETHGQIVTGNPFVNAGGGNYYLANVPGTDCTSTTTVCAGLPLPPPYNKDASGNTFGLLGNWDRGTFAFASTAPQPPTNLKATVN